ncbi:MAG: right-handed parallel beta-helix repeat-containing protein [Planctomycetes bacterium]|nr:right-handed parallel beta-helix repeat-containing protein [Planctomycetota bacterium]
MPHRRFPHPPMAGVLFAILAAGLPAQSWLPSSPYPTWSSVQPLRTLRVDYDSGKTSSENGEVLHTAMLSLQPGDELKVGSGTYTIDARLELTLQGTATAPIWITAANLGSRPVVTRSDAKQNALNLGSFTTAVKYLCLRGLEITNGSELVRILLAEQLWMDKCYIHDGNGTGIAANTVDISYLYLTENEIARPGPGQTGEGMYLGANGGASRVTYSVIAFNHVHSTTSSTQGDGIELKQGSHHNWVVGNHVHDTKYPCILVYGTGGNDINVIENNLCYNSGDAALQVQGEAIVRNNIAMNGSDAFACHDHQGQTTNLVVVHNTFVNSKTGCLLNSWDNRAGMVFANNVVYSETGAALQFGKGSAGAVLAGNVIYGTVTGASSGYVLGAGIGDFVAASWDATKRDVRPVVGGPIDNRGVSRYAVPLDAAGQPRSLPINPGALANDATMVGDVRTITARTGGQQILTFVLGPGFAGEDYLLLGSASGSTPGVVAGDFELPLVADVWFNFTLSVSTAPLIQSGFGQLDGAGKATPRIVLPALPVVSGTELRHAMLVFRGGGLEFVANPVTLKLE